MSNLYKILWKLGTLSGCHQLPSRSIKIKGKQLPVCARCTVAFFGYITGLSIYSFFHIPVWLSLLLCFIMLYDWLLQRFFSFESTNIRRLVSGFLCGIGLIHLYIDFLLLIIRKILEINIF